MSFFFFQIFIYYSGIIQNEITDEMVVWLSCEDNLIFVFHSQVLSISIHPCSVQGKDNSCLLVLSSFHVDFVKLMFIYLHTIGTSSASLTLLICQVNKRQSLYSGRIYRAFYLSSKYAVTKYTWIKKSYIAIYLNI